MRFRRNTYGWPSLFAVLAVCVLLGLTFTYGCGKIRKKDAFEPGNEWIEDMRDRVSENVDDPGKRTRMLALVDQFEKDLLEVDRIIDSRFKMRDLSTPETWEKLTDIKKRKGLYKQTIRQPGQ